jgi:hypothetical protein
MGKDQRAFVSKEGVCSLFSTKKLLMVAVCSEMSVESWEILLGEDIVWQGVKK